jgi:hypothetical protein
VYIAMLKASQQYNSLDSVIIVTLNTQTKLTHKDLIHSCIKLY